MLNQQLEPTPINRNILLDVHEISISQVELPAEMEAQLSQLPPEEQPQKIYKGILLIYGSLIKYFPTHPRGLFDEFFVAENLAYKIKEQMEVETEVEHSILFSPGLQKLIGLIKSAHVGPEDRERLDNIGLN